MSKKQEKIRDLIFHEYQLKKNKSNKRGQEVPHELNKTQKNRRISIAVGCSANSAGMDWTGS